MELDYDRVFEFSFGLVLKFFRDYVVEYLIFGSLLILFL